MVEVITFQTIFQFLQTISIMVGIAYYLMILNNQQKSQNLQLETRQAQLVTQILLKNIEIQNIQTYFKVSNLKWTD